MKKSIISIAIVAATVLGLSKSTYAAVKSTEEVTTLSEVTRINKIEVHGNVELFVSDGTTDQVKVYNKYYSENALIQDQNGVLRITSYGTQKLVVWVKASNLSSLSVYDDAEVKSFGKLSAIDLGVQLYDSAAAQLNIDAYQANITLNGHSKADLSGEVTESIIHHNISSSVNTTNFAVTHLTKKVNTDAVELASL